MSEQHQLTRFKQVFGDVLHYDICNDTEFLVVRLCYHVALYVNPTMDGGFDDRYCIHSLPVALKAIEVYPLCGEIWYWQKHHNKRIRVVENLLYRDDDLCIPENAIGTVTWNADDIRKFGVFSCHLISASTSTQTGAAAR
jgi:hypothetical protein